jgi:myo-inositol-1(or 4)-monophosphatase
VPALTTSTVETLEALAVATGRAAAKLIRATAGAAVAVGLKSSPSDVVTQTDIDTETMIRAMLNDATPGAGFVGEEGGTTPPTFPSALSWIIDPLDGTVNFTYGLPVIAVSIAAAIDGTVVAGAVVDILRDEVFSAAAGLGARCDGTPITVSACDDISRALVTTGFSYSAELRRQQGELAGRLIPIVRDIRCFGSAALQLCWVACGRVDAYYERDTKVWDYAAGALIAAEAGATVELPCPENDSLSVAAPRAVFGRLRSLVEYPAS